MTPLSLSLSNLSLVKCILLRYSLLQSSVSGTAAWLICKWHNDGIVQSNTIWVNVTRSIIHSSSLMLIRSFSCLEYWTRTALNDSQRDMKCSLSSGSLSQSLHVGSTLCWLNFALFAWRTYAPVRILHELCSSTVPYITPNTVPHWVVFTDR